MGHALILNSYSKANITGGAFEALTANSGDSLAVPVLNGASGGRILEVWGADSAAVADFDIRSTRLHDNTRGLRFSCASLTPAAAAKNGAKRFLPGPLVQQLYSGDTLTVEVNGTAADNVILSALMEYDDLAGVTPRLATWDEISPRIVNLVGIRCDAVASGTAGAYGADRALNADDDRLNADTDYALLGATSQLACAVVAMRGNDFAGQKIGLPLTYNSADSAAFFVDLAAEYKRPLIPIINANNKGGIFCSAADHTASTSPKIDWIFAELG